MVRLFGVLGRGELDKALPIWEELHESLSIKLQVEEIIAEGKIVAVRYTERGTSVKPFRGHAATGKSYEIVAIEWFIVQDGRIHQRWERVILPHSFARWRYL
jgi:hypothetical protein